jgi:undecaprenyl pyrophosphate phosphatase UppP
MTVIHDTHAVLSAWSQLRSLPILLYIGPDQIMPLTSVLGAIIGVALMFWNRVVSLAHRCLTLFSRRTESEKTASK